VQIVNQDGLGTHPEGTPKTPLSIGVDELESLVARAASNEEQAWTELIGLYSRRVYALARSRLRDSHLAEEITQAVFVSVYQYLSSGRYESAGKFEPWLFRIAMNRVRDHIRRTARRPAHTHDTSSLTPAESQEWNLEEDVGRLRSAVSQLPELDQEIIALRHQAGLEFKAIAVLLDEPVGTLLARHHRALAKLRKYLNPATAHENTA
jgi:RNA polymerase sigma-70 factor (ECF subfamily)